MYHARNTTQRSTAQHAVVAHPERNIFGCVCARRDSGAQDFLDESISTCRFAQRIAMVSNAVGINEEVDPTLIIKRLKTENRELKDELKLLRGENDDRGDLTESEVERLRGQVTAYCQARGPGDDAELDVGASMLKIKAAIKIFREIVLQGGGGVVRGVGGAVGGKAAAAWAEDSGGGGSGGGAGSEEMKLEVKRLALQVKQRDNEINILVSMLQKGEGGTKGAQRATAAFPVVNTSDPRATLEALQTQRGEDSVQGPGGGPGPTSSSSTDTSAAAAAEPPPDIMALLADRNKAFEHFRRSYRRNEAIEENKALLKEKYGRAKALGERVNASRAAINQLKATIEQRRVAQSLVGLGSRV
jgi:kinesin family protein 6/9